MNKLAELGWGQENPAFRQFFTTQFIPGGTAEQHAWFNELERVSTSPLNAARFMRVFNEIDVVKLLPRVSCPTLVLHAVRDARVPFDEGRRQRDSRRALRAAQIAAHLDLCEKTVRNHITSIFAKLEVENRAQAIVLARKAGFDRAGA